MIDHDSASDSANRSGLPGIRAALLAGVLRHRARTRARAFGAGVAVAAVGAAGLVGGVLSQEPSPALAAALVIEPNGRWIEVEIVEADAGEQQMSTELRHAGIDASVEIIPTIRGRTGEWMGLQRVEAPGDGGAPPHGAAPGPAQIWDPDDIGADGRVLMIRRSALGRLEHARWVFYVGREPDRGETRQVLFDDGPREIGPRWRGHVE